MNMALEEVTPRTNPNETRRSMDATPTSLPPKRDAAARVGFFVSFMAMAPWLQASLACVREKEKRSALVVHTCS
jgi:hypothetical protein